MKRRVPLEPAATKEANNTLKCPRIYQLPPCEGRKLLDTAQDSPIETFPVTYEKVKVDTGKWGNVIVYAVTPCNDFNTHHIIYYIHGGGWVFGDFHTHYKLICELAYRTNSVIIFPEYSLSPKAKYPTALEQCYFVLTCIPEIVNVLSLKVCDNTLTVAGDSAGGNMATVLTLLSKYRKGPHIHKQLLFYPVTNACFETKSYKEFANDYYLYRSGMIWYWNQYTACIRDRQEITASPLRASLVQLSNLPAAMIINGEADVLRDEGEAYATKLLLAGVDVTAIQVQATIHDFVMLNSLDQSNATRIAMDAATCWINRKNY